MNSNIKWLIFLCLSIVLIFKGFSQSELTLRRVDLAKVDLNRRYGVDPSKLSNVDKQNLIKDLNNIVVGTSNLLRRAATPKKSESLPSQVTNFANPDIVLFRTNANGGQIGKNSFEAQVNNPINLSNVNIDRNFLFKYEALREQVVGFQTVVNNSKFIRRSKGSIEIGNTSNNFFIGLWNWLTGNVATLVGGVGEIGVEDLVGFDAQYDPQAIADVIETLKIKEGVGNVSVKEYLDGLLELKSRETSTMRFIVNTLKNDFGLVPVLTDVVKLQNVVDVSFVNLSINPAQLDAWQKEAGVEYFTPGGVGAGTKGIKNLNSKGSYAISKNGKIIPYHTSTENYQQGNFTGSFEINDKVYFGNFDLNSSISSIPKFIDSNGNISESSIFTYSNNTSIDKLLSRGDPSGIDFRNVKVAALDIQNATKTVRLILQGDSFTDNSSPASSLNENAKLAKEVFLQALAIPNNQQFVSLELVNGSGQAVADSNFKKTKIAPIFFEADADMKKDVAEFLLGTGNFNSRVGIYEKWINALKNHDESRLLSMVSNYDDRIIPKLTVKGTIVPRTPQGGNSSSRLFINNSDYNLNMTVENIPNIFSNISNTNDRNYLISRWAAFQNTFFNEINEAGTAVRNRINSGATADYKRLLIILPSIVAAHWYKQQSNDTKKEFGSLINTSNLSSISTGISLTNTFDQSYFNNLANRVLAEKTIVINTSSGNIRGKLQMRGGVEVEQINIGGLGNNTQSTIIASISTDTNGRIGNSLTTTGNDQFIYGGTADYNLSELQITSFSFDKDNSSVDINNPVEYELNEGLEFTIRAANIGSKTAANAKLDLFLKGPGDNSFRRFEGVKKNIAVGQYLFLKGSLSLKTPGIYALRAVIDNDNKIREFDDIDNNEYARKLRIKSSFSCNVDTNLSVTNNHFIVDNSIEPLFMNSRNFTAGNPNRKFVVGTKGKVQVHATRKIIFRPGTHFRWGCNVRAFISSCESANNQYKSLSRSKEMISSTKKLKKYREKEILATKTEIVNKNNQLSEIERSVKEMLNSTIRNNIVNVVNNENIDLIGDSDQLIKIYPNPAEDVLYLYHGLSDLQKISISIYSLSGKIIKTFDSNQLLINDNEISINVKNLSDGMYVIKGLGDISFSSMFIKE